jgi:hypothetical protein
MNAPMKPLLALAAAFVAGVTVTAVFVAPKPDKATVQQGTTDITSHVIAKPNTDRMASLSPASGVLKNSSASEGSVDASADKWVDPVKQRTPPSAAKPALPPLVFHLDDKPGRPNDRAPSESKQADERSVRQSFVAQTAPPRRPKPSELIATREDQRNSVTATESTDRTLVSRPSPDAPGYSPHASQPTAKLRYKAEPVRAAAIAERDDRELPDVVRPPRQAYMARRAHNDTPSQRIRYADRYERDSDSYIPSNRLPSTSAGSSGVIRWLSER